MFLPKPFISKIIKKTLKDGGVTADLHDFSLIAPQDLWYFPKHPSKTHIVPVNCDLEKVTKEYINDNEIWLMEKGNLLGIWLNPENHKYYFDIITSHKESSEALKLAKNISRNEGRDIVAIFNPFLQKTLYLHHPPRTKRPIED